MFGEKIKKILSRVYDEVTGWKGPDRSISPLDYLASGDLLEEPFWMRYGLARGADVVLSGKTEPVGKNNCLDKRGDPDMVPICCPVSTG